MLNKTNAAGGALNWKEPDTRQEDCSIEPDDRTRIHTGWNEYKAAIKDFKTLPRKAKMNSWQTFCEELQTAETARLRRIKGTYCSVNAP